MNLQCLKKLGICLYEENYYTEEIIQIQDNTKVPSIKEINKVSTKKLTKEADNELTNELTDKSTNELTNKSTNELTNE